VTGAEWIQTNDVVELWENGFVWKGRADWVINSGGVKIHPEDVERKIANYFPAAEAIVTKRKHEPLGEQVVLCSKEPILDAIHNCHFLDKYEEPKVELILEQFPRTPSGKIDRLALQKIAAQRTSEE